MRGVWDIADPGLNLRLRIYTSLNFRGLVLKRGTVQPTRGRLGRGPHNGDNLLPSRPLHPASGLGDIEQQVSRTTRREAGQCQKLPLSLETGPTRGARRLPHKPASPGPTSPRGRGTCSLRALHLCQAWATTPRKPLRQASSLDKFTVLRKAGVQPNGGAGAGTGNSCPKGL